MRLPDPIERMEERSEGWAFENIKGDSFKCCCEEWCKLVDGETISSDPYAVPVCPKCFDKWYEEERRKNKCQ